MNKIVIELAAEDRKRIDELIAAIGLAVGELHSLGVPVCKELRAALPHTIEQADDGTVKLVKNDHPADAPATHLEPPAVGQPAPDTKPVSLAEFQKAITMRCAESQKTKEAVRALVNQYASSVSDIPEDKRPEVLAALAAI